jgi:hypothetical protein
MASFLFPDPIGLSAAAAISAEAARPFPKKIAALNRLVVLFRYAPVTGCESRAADAMIRPKRRESSAIMPQASGGGPNMGYAVAGVILVILIVVVGTPFVRVASILLHEADD